MESDDIILPVSAGCFSEICKGYKSVIRFVQASKIDEDWGRMDMGPENGGFFVGIVGMLVKQQVEWDAQKFQTKPSKFDQNVDVTWFRMGNSSEDSVEWMAMRYERDVSQWRKSSPTNMGRMGRLKKPMVGCPSEQRTVQLSRHMIWRFPEMGVPLVIIHWNAGFSMK